MGLVDMENRFVRFVIDVEYTDWWDDDNQRWAPPTLDQACRDVRHLIDYLSTENVIKVTMNDDIVYETVMV